MQPTTPAAYLRLGSAAAIAGAVADAAAVHRLQAAQAGILTPASLPETLGRPDLLTIVAVGLGVGLGLGILFVFLRHRGPQWTLRMAGYSVAGCILAAAVWILMRGTFAGDGKSYQFVTLGAFAGLALGAFRLRHRKAPRAKPANAPRATNWQLFRSPANVPRIRIQTAAARAHPATE